MNIAVLITVYNRKEKTLRCLESLEQTLACWREDISIKVYLTDDGCTDGTADAIRSNAYSFPVKILQGDGSLFWNGGMINSWKAALADGGYDGYLWLNDDTVVLNEFWQDLLDADRFSRLNYGKGGIYAGSTKDEKTGAFTYGGFIYVNKILLKDKFLYPNGTFQSCEAVHGNITFVSSEVVDSQGIFCEKYIHGGTDHDYSYLAHKAGFPVLVLPHYSGECENDHIIKNNNTLRTKTSLKQRIKLFYSPKGYNMHNTLLFNRRCFWWRVPFVYVAGIMKLLFPTVGFKIYRTLRRWF